MKHAFRQRRPLQCIHFYICQRNSILPEVAILELNIKLCVIATICDGATPNRKLFKLHKGLIIAQTVKCHKTARNSLFNSGSCQSSRYMWNNGKDLIWRHITGAFDLG